MDYWRRNPDSQLRELERQYAASGDDPRLRSAINVQRLRAGLKLLPPIYRLFRFGPQDYYQMQSPLAGIMVSSAGTLHDGWIGIDHGAWKTDNEDDVYIDLGTHVANRIHEDPLQVIKAHLEVLGAIETRGLSNIQQFYRWGDFDEGHEVDISMYDLSSSPLRHVLQCCEPGEDQSYF